jgi:hypothetical protein
MGHFKQYSEANPESWTFCSTNQPHLFNKSMPQLKGERAAQEKWNSWEIFLD